VPRWRTPGAHGAACRTKAGNGMGEGRSGSSEDGMGPPLELAIVGWMSISLYLIQIEEWVTS
jgi:hypothetical protein